MREKALTIEAVTRLLTLLALVVTDLAPTISLPQAPLLLQAAAYRLPNTVTRLSHHKVEQLMFWGRLE